MIAFTPDFAEALIAYPELFEAQSVDELPLLSRMVHSVRYGAGLVLTDAGGNAMMHFEQAPE